MKNTIKDNKAITLIALIITIIVLLILAGISIASLTGSGLFGKTKEAKEKHEEATKKENMILGSYLGIINAENKATTIKEACEDEMLYKTVNSDLTDEYGNKIVVPAGFKILDDETTKNAITVDKGIVIVDKNGNEFVWIPVPEDGFVYKDKNKTAVNDIKIELNRYTFAETTGAPTSKNEEAIETNFEELQNSTKENITAKSIINFKNSVQKNKGYYIARYEARTTVERKTENDQLKAITTKSNDYVYNFVKQSQAAELSKKMYTSEMFTSDLMNSYAWDTATLFLQECGTNSTYSRETTVNENTLAPKGTNDTTLYDGAADVQCNVYDMASNVFEWTTETSKLSGFPCASRGGSYYNNTRYTSCRNNSAIDFSVERMAFRPILYIAD